MATVAPYFYSGPESFPGKVFRIYYEPDYVREAEHLTATLGKDEFYFAKQEGCTLIATSHSMQLPDEHWYAHIHMDCDSHLTSPDGETIHHAGYIPEDEYYSNDYQPDEEVSAAWDKAASDQVERIIREEVSGDSTNNRVSEESN